MGSPRPGQHCGSGGASPVYLTVGSTECPAPLPDGLVGVPEIFPSCFVHRLKAPRTSLKEVLKLELLWSTTVGLASVLCASVYPIAIAFTIHCVWKVGLHARKCLEWSLEHCLLNGGYCYHCPHHNRHPYTHHHHHHNYLIACISNVNTITISSPSLSSPS